MPCSAGIQQESSPCCPSPDGRQAPCGCRNSLQGSQGSGCGRAGCPISTWHCRSAASSDKTHVCVTLSVGNPWLGPSPNREQKESCHVSISADSNLLLFSSFSSLCMKSASPSPRCRMELWHSSVSSRPSELSLCREGLSHNAAQDSGDGSREVF